MLSVRSSDNFQLSMASTVLSDQVAKESLFKEGFFQSKDLAVGEDVSKMENRSFEFFTVDGLDFCKRRVLNQVGRTRHSTNAHLTSYSA